MKLLAQTGIMLDPLDPLDPLDVIDVIDVIELNEAFAAQGLAVLRLLCLKDDEERVNAWGDAIALGHPLGASGARLVATATKRLHATGGRYRKRRPWMLRTGSSRLHRLMLGPNGFSRELSMDIRQPTPTGPFRRSSRIQP